MMPSKKGQLSSNSSTSTLRKKARSFSVVDNFNEDEVIDHINIFKVRDILDETSGARGSYLIDWENDPITGVTYSPTWEPKRNANALAVSAWRKKRKKKNRRGNQRPHIRSRELLSPSRSADHFHNGGSIEPLKIAQPQLISTSSPTALGNGSVKQAESALTSAEVGETQPTQLSADDQPRVAVQILPYSSLDRDQYLTYESSQSAQGLSSSQPEHLASGLSHSSSLNPFSRSTIFGAKGVIPDSQPLPGSSSYEQTASNCTTRSSFTYTRGTDFSSSSLERIDTLVVPSPNFSTIEASDPIEDPSSHALVSSSNRALPSQRALYVPFEERLSASQGLSLTSDQRRLSSTVPSLGITKTAQEIVVFHTPDGSAIETQGTQSSQTSAPSTEEILQNAQIVPKSAVPDSQNSSENLKETSIRSARLAEINSKITQVGFGSGIAIPIDTVSVSQDHNIRSENLEKLYGVILSCRDLNSQPEKILQSAQSKDDIILVSVEPADFMVEGIFSSSPLPVLSQVADPLDSNTNPKPTIRSNTEMSDAPQVVIPTPPKMPQPESSLPHGTPLRERLRAMRAASAARAAIRTPKLDTPPSALSRITKSPSLIPESSTRDVVGDSRINVQTVEVPQQSLYTPTHPSKLSLHKDMSEFQNPTTLNSLNLDKMEFVVPLPLPSRIRDQYFETVNYYQDPISRFMKAELANDTTVQQLQLMITRLNNITAHIDLDNESTLTQQDATPEDQVIWAVSCSAKFQFLKHLIEFMRYRAERIAIVCREGRLLEILETFLKGVHVHYDRPDTFSSSTPAAACGRLQISLIASGEAGSSTLPSTSRLVIAFDGSFTVNDPQVRSSRDHMLNVGQLSPVIHLLVYSSAEHIERCLPDSIKGTNRLKAIVSWIAHTRHQAGELLDEEFQPHAAAEEVAMFVDTDGLDKEWTLQAIRAIEGLEDEDSSQSVDLDSATQSDTQTSRNQSTDIPPSIQKRSLDTSKDVVNTPKRQRMTPLPEVMEVNGSLTQGLEVPTQIIAELRTALQEARDELITTKDSHSVREASLQGTIASTEKRLQEHIEELSALQNRYEQRNRSYHSLRHEKDDSTAAAATANSKVDMQTEIITSLKAARAALETDLKEAREALQTSTIPEIALFEKAKSEAKTLATENASLLRKIEFTTRDFEFTRQQYQIASSSAAESASRVSELEAEISSLKIQASGEAVRLRSMNDRSELERHIERIGQLEAELEDREELLRKKERGRGVQTRAGSVQPRSPRMGSRAGSRAASPMPGGFLAVMGGDTGPRGLGKAGSGLRFG